MTTILALSTVFAWTAFLLFWPLLALGLIAVIPRDRPPATAIAWLLAIGLLPVVGLLAFVVFGHARLPRSHNGGRRRIDQEIREGYTALSRSSEQSTARPDPGDRAGPLQRLVTTHGGLPAVGGNRVRFLPEYQESIQAMADAIHQAKSYVHAEFFTLAEDEETEPFLQALEEAHVLGIKVRVLLDHHGSRTIEGYGGLVERLDASGIEWYRMLPLEPTRGRFARPDLRNHRKLLVVDGVVGFTGSQNMVDRTYHMEDKDGSTPEFVDLMARLEGPIVQQLDAVFRSDWYAEAGEKPAELPLEARDPERRPGHDCQLMPSGPGHPFENMLRLNNALLYHAREKVVIVSPYVVPDNSLMMAITSAAARGVQVQVITTERGDRPFLNHAQRSYYAQMLEAGVEIYLYPHPKVLHSKSITIDDEVAMFGSSNMDMRSFHLNLEACVVAYDRDVVRQLRPIEDGYRRASLRLEQRQWQLRPAGQRVLSRAARLTAALQ